MVVFSKRIHLVKAKNIVIALVLQCETCEGSIIKNDPFNASQRQQGILKMLEDIHPN